VITKLHLRNFKKHTDASFDFTEGFNGIFGGNYTGKTTILYGILYALGGASAVPGTRILTRGASAGLKVSMEFSAGGTEYEVSRTKTSANLLRGEEVIATGTTGVNSAIEDILGMSMKRFLQLRYAAQKEAHTTLTLGATELHSLLEELTGIATLSKALGRLKTMGVGFKAQLEVLPEEDVEAIAAEVAEATSALRVARGSVASAEKEALGKGGEVEKIASEVTGMLSLAEGWGRYKDKLTTARASLEAATSSASSSRQSVEAAAAVCTSEDLKAAEAEVRMLGVKGQEAREYYKAEGALQSAKAAADLAESELHASESAFSTLSFRPGTLSKAVGEAAEAKAAKGFAKSAWDDSKLLLTNRVCVACHRELDGALSQADLESAEAKAKVILAEAKLRLSDCQDAVVELKTAEAQWRKKAKDRDEASASLLWAEDKAGDKRRVFSALCPPALSKAELADLDTTIEKATADWELKETQTEKLNTLQQKLAACEALAEKGEDDLQRLLDKPPADLDYGRLSDLQQKLVLGELSLETLQEVLAQARSVSTALQAQLPLLKERLLSAQSRQADRQAALSRQASAISLSKFLTSNRDRYSAEAWDFFMASASQFVSACTEGAVSEVVRTDAGKFEFVEDGFKMSIKEASGAQAAILGLGVKVALSQSAPCPLDILLVDEPTADMDAEHSMATTAVLASGSTQVIGISHRDMDQSLCNNSIVL